MGRPPDRRKTNPLTPDSLAAEGEGGGDRNLGARLGRYGKAKARSHEMAGYLLQASEGTLSRRLYQCGSYLHFREWLHHGRTTLHQGYFCQVPLLCPLCAIRRGGKLLRRYVERANYLLRDHDAWMVTLTVKNGPDLAERFAHLKASFGKLRKRAAKGYSELAKAAGYVGAFEFTRNAETGDWHPHLHMVWFLPKGTPPIRYGEGSQLRADWESITGDSFITHAQRIECEPGREASKALVDAFCEVLKYALKFSTLSLADNLAAYFTLKGKRLMTSGGCVYGLELPEDAKLEDDPLDGPFIEIVYRFAGALGYVLQDSWVGDESPRGVSFEKDRGRPTLPPQEVGSHADVGQAIGPNQDHAFSGSARAAASDRAAGRPGAGNARVGVGGRESALARGAGRDGPADRPGDGPDAGAAVRRAAQAG